MLDRHNARSLEVLSGEHYLAARRGYQGILSRPFVHLSPYFRERRLRFILARIFVE